MKLKQRKSTSTPRRGGGKKIASAGAKGDASTPRRGTGPARSGNTARRTTQTLRTRVAKQAKAG